MLIVTRSGEAINAHHTVRFFLQSDTNRGEPTDTPASFRLVLQLTNRQKVIAAELTSEANAQTLFREVLRQWMRGQPCIDITACLKRIEKGETAGDGWKEVCL